MTLPVCLSRTGSDRATAYDPSCKLLRRGDDLVMGWLDSPEQEGGPARIRRYCNGRTQQTGE